ncbi:MAG: transposase, partial [Balneolaceae bacterium]
LPLFTFPEVADVILEVLTFLQEERDVKLYAYVIMENHIHFIVEGGDLKKKLRLSKSFAANRIIDVLKERGKSKILDRLKWSKLKHKKHIIHQVWAEGLHPIQLTSVEMVNQKMEYIHMNPVKRGYVDRPEHWRYSSARHYLGGEGLIPITLFGG